MDDAWARVRREIGQVARQAAEQIQQLWFSRASALGGSPGPLPPTARRDPAWPAG